MNTYDLSGKTAVVTGGAQGIGLAVVKRLLASGARVASWDANTEMNQQSAATHDAGDGVIAVTCDVSNWDQVTGAVVDTETALGGIDIVVNSAGIAGPNTTVEAYDNDAWNRIIAIKLTGTYYVNKSVVAGMRSRGYGRILNIVSIAGKEGNPIACAYSASKAGVIGFTKSLGKELAVKTLRSTASHLRRRARRSLTRCRKNISTICCPKSPVPGFLRSKRPQI
jgi:NAD(P)-dependent dehydrogenase (short-subunit alcohol dehydrogenase family)